MALGESLIERRTLRDAILGHLARHRLVMLIAPPVSGKATLMGQIRQDLAESRGAAEPVTLIERFDALPAEVQARQALAIEAAAAAGEGRFLITSERPLHPLFAAARLRGQARELGLASLALDETQARALLGEALSAAVSARAMRALLEKTEGWVGAWTLLRTLLERGARAADLARGFSGADRDLAALFERLVLPAMDPEIADFLLQVGPFERVCEEMATAVTGRADALALLEAAARQCAFCEDLDRAGEWRRIHPLLRDYLAWRARRDDPARLAANLTRGAEWAAGRSDWLLASRLHAEAGEPDRAVEILVRYSDEVIAGRGEVLDFRRLAPSLARHPGHASQLGTELALGSVLSGDFAGAAGLLARLTAHGAPLSKAQRERLGAVSLNLDFGFERFDRVIAGAPRWLERETEASPRLRGMVAVALFWSCHAQADSAGARRAIAAARTEIARSEAPFLEAWLAIIEALDRLEHGRVTEAEILLESAAGEGGIRHTADLVRAATALEMGQAERAQRLLGESLDTGLRHSVTELALLGWSAAAALAWRDDAPEAALALLRTAEPLMASRHGERGRRLILLLRARLRLQAPSSDGLAPAAQDLAAAAEGPDALALSRTFVEALRLGQARLLIRQGDPRAALALLAPIIASSQRSGRLRAWGEASLMQGAALARTGEAERALRQVWRTLETLAGHGLRRTATDERLLLSPLIEALAERAAKAREAEEPAAVLVSDLAAEAGWPGPAGPLPAAESGPSLPVQLTEMERRVLNLTAEGCSNGEIAERAMIKVATVKWHLQNLFHKLDVRSRTAALAAARRAGLLGQVIANPRRADLTSP